MFLADDTGRTKVRVAISTEFGALVGIWIASPLIEQNSPCRWRSFGFFTYDSGSVGNFVSRTIITGGQSSKVAHFLYGFSAGFGVCGGGGGGAHA